MKEKSMERTDLSHEEWINNRSADAKQQIDRRKKEGRCNEKG
jgi:hypothetical protein